MSHVNKTSVRSKSNKLLGLKIPLNNYQAKYQKLRQILGKVEKLSLFLLLLTTINVNKNFRGGLVII